MCARIIILAIATFAAEGSPIFNMQTTKSGTDFIVRRNRNLNNAKWYSSYYNGINNDSEKLAEVYGVPANIEQVNTYRHRSAVLFATPSGPEKVYGQSSSSDFVNAKHSISRRPFVENSHLNTKRDEALYRNNGFVFDDNMQSNMKNSYNFDSSTEPLKGRENLASAQEAATGYDMNKSGSATSEMDMNNGKIEEIQHNHNNKQDSTLIKQKPVDNDESVESGLERNHGTKNTNAEKSARPGQDETTTFIPDIRNRVSFDGGSCPTGQIKIAGKCVVVDS